MLTLTDRASRGGSMSRITRRIVGAQPGEGHDQVRRAWPFASQQRGRQRARRMSNALRREKRPAPGLPNQPRGQRLGRCLIAVVDVQQRRPAVGRHRHAARAVYRRETGVAQQLLHAHNLADGGISVVRCDENVRGVSAAIRLHPGQELAELGIGFREGLRRPAEPHAVFVLRLVRFRRPQQRHRRISFGQYEVRQDASRVNQARRVGQILSRPIAEPFGQFGLQRPWQREIGMYGRPARRRRIRVVNVGVAAGARANRKVLHTVFTQQVGQCWYQQCATSGIGDLLQRGFQRRYHPVRIVFSTEEGVARQSVPPGRTPRDQTRRVDPGHRREHRMVVCEGDAPAGEFRQVGHQPRGDLRRLEAVEHHNQYSALDGHQGFPPVFSSPLAAATLAIRGSVAATPQRRRHRVSQC